MVLANGVIFTIAIHNLILLKAGFMPTLNREKIGCFFM